MVLHVYVHVYIHCTVEPLYCGHHWEPSNCLDCRGVLNSGVVLYGMGQKQVSILERCPYFRGVHSERFHCTCTYVHVHCIQCTHVFLLSLILYYAYSSPIGLLWSLVTRETSWSGQRLLIMINWCCVTYGT